MFYIFIGTDIEETRKAASECVAKESVGGIPVVRVDAYQTVIPEEVIFGSSLFGGKRIVVLDGLLENKKWTPTNQDIELLREGKDVFIFIEEAIPEEMEDLFKKEKIESFDKKKEKFGWSKKHYAFADAFIARRKKESWVLYQELLREGARPEELHSVLFWAMKNVGIAFRAKSAAESGLHAFVYGKSKSAGERLGNEGTATLLNQLVRTYHESRRGSDFELLLERLVLQ